MRSYSWERFAVDCLLTFLLSWVIQIASNAFVWGLGYVICLIIAAVFVFLGEILIVSRSSVGGGRGGWDWDIW